MSQDDLMPTALTDGVWWFDLTSVNAYLVVDGDDLVLCDACMASHADTIRQHVHEAGFEFDEIDRVLVTHYDIDHVGGLAALGLDAPVHLGAVDAAMLREERRPSLRNHKGLLQRAMGRFVHEPATEIRPIEDGDIVGDFTAYHTPGHVVYVSEERDVALLGDLVRGKNDGPARPRSPRPRSLRGWSVGGLASPPR